MEVTNATSNHFADRKAHVESSKPKVDPIKVYRKEVEQDAQKATALSRREMEHLIANLNDEISLLRTDLRFGFNSTAEMLQVSVIDTKTEKIIRRFPTEEAVTLMSSMREFIGLLFDEKG